MVKKQCYLIPPAPTKAKIRERWRRIQQGDIAAALGIDGVRFEDGNIDADQDFDYNFGYQEDGEPYE